MSKIYEDYGLAESAYDMVQNATVKEVKGGCVILTHDGHQLLSDATLEDRQIF